MATKNYAKFLKLPVQEKGKKTGDRERPFSNEELQALWNNLYNYEIDKYKIIDIILILCYTGLRIGELLKVNRKNIYYNTYILILTENIKFVIIKKDINIRIINRERK